jgi:hypothetical protein
VRREKLSVRPIGPVSLAMKTKPLIPVREAHEALAAFAEIIERK